MTSEARIISPPKLSRYLTYSNGVNMHEFGVTQAALEAAIKNAEEAGAVQIAVVHLAIGTVSSIEPESIRLYWNEISKDTLAEGAVLKFRRVPTETACIDCGERYMPGSENACPSCASENVRVLDDEFLALEAIDVEQASTREIA